MVEATQTQTDMMMVFDDSERPNSSERHDSTRLNKDLDFTPSRPNDEQEEQVGTNGFIKYVGCHYSDRREKERGEVRKQGQ